MARAALPDRRPRLCVKGFGVLLAMDVIIYHNPDCGTSRNTLGMIRNAGIEPHVIEYLKTPPARALLKQLIGRMGVTARSVLREKGTPFDDLGLARDAGCIAFQTDLIGDSLHRGGHLIHRIDAF